MTNGWWMIVPDNLMLSVLVLFAIAVPFLYAARQPMHRAIRSAVRAIAGPLRLGGRWLHRTAVEMRARNKEVLLAHGREEMQQTLAREFERITTLVQRDLHGYPALQRKLMDEITKIEEDYQRCSEVPPPSEQWADAIKALSTIKPANALVEKILEDIADSIEKIHQRSLSEYRRAYHERHKILKGFAPFWRSLNQTLTQVDRNIGGLQSSAQKIDNQMSRFEAIVSKTNQAQAMLAQSGSRQFVIDTLVMAIAVMGAYINSRLIELPLREMVGAGDYLVGNITVSDVAAMVIIFVEATMGIFLMESLGITHLFAKFGSMSAVMRRRLIWISLTILSVLAFVEVALAVMRDFIAVENIKLKSQLNQDATAAMAEAAAVQAQSWVSKVPVAGQMVLGFILPFALAFIAIPLESFITSSRTVVGVGLVMAVQSVAFTMRVLASVVRYTGSLLTSLYDVTIFLPLTFERLWRLNGKSKQARSRTASI